MDEATFLRRTVYAKVSRMELSRLLRLFDFPDPNLSNERRIDTTQPQQSLFLLNSPFMIARARTLAALGADDPARRIYVRTFGREPSAAELEIATAFLSAADKEPVKLSRVERYAQALLASNAFLFID